MSRPRPLTTIPRRGDGHAPLSSHQRSIWFSERMHSDVAFNIPFACRLTGPLCEKSLRRSLEHVMSRHEVLRSTFEVDRRELHQLVRPPAALDLPVVDLTALDPDDRIARCQTLTRDEARRPFDIASGPLLRARLFRIEEELHELLVTVHHLVFDGWSMGILLLELTAGYEAYSRGREPHLPELRIQYGDYAHWQQSWSETPRASVQLQWWRKQLGGRFPRMDLPTCRPRPEARTYRGAQVTDVYPADLTRTLAEVARREGATLFQVLLAGFAVLLSREGCGEKIVVGTPFFARSVAETAPLIGPFVNVLLLRTDLGGDPCFRELLRRVRDTAMGAFANSDLPLETLIRALEPDRNPAAALSEELRRAPVAVQFQLLSLPDGAYEREGGGLAFRLVNLDIGSIWSDLELTFLEADGGLLLRLRYNTDLFERIRISRLSRNLRRLLEAAEEGMDRPISTLSVAQ